MKQSIVKIININSRTDVRSMRVILDIQHNFGRCISEPTYSDIHGDALVKHSCSGVAKVIIDGKNVGRMMAPGNATFYF